MVVEEGDATWIVEEIDGPSEGVERKERVEGVWNGGTGIEKGSED